MGLTSRLVDGKPQAHTRLQVVSMMPRVKHGSVLVDDGTTRSMLASPLATKLRLKNPSMEACTTAAVSATPTKLSLFGKPMLAQPASHSTSPPSSLHSTTSTNNSSPGFLPPTPVSGPINAPWKTASTTSRPRKRTASRRSSVLREESASRRVRSSSPIGSISRSVLLRARLSGSLMGSTGRRGLGMERLGGWLRRSSDRATKWYESVEECVYMVEDRSYGWLFCLFKLYSVAD